MLRSMTGFGAAAREARGLVVRAEVRSVNHRHFQAKLRLPLELAHLESQAEALLRARLERGSVQANVQVRREGAAAAARIDRALLRAYHEEAPASSAELGIPHPGLGSLLQLPGRVAPSELEGEDPKIVRQVREVLGEACAELVRMREEEGRALGPTSAAAPTRSRSSPRASPSARPRSSEGTSARCGGASPSSQARAPACPRRTWRASSRCWRTAWTCRRSSRASGPTWAAPQAPRQGRPDRPQARLPGPGVPARGEHDRLEVGRRQDVPRRDRAEDAHRAPARAGAERRVSAPASAGAPGRMLLISGPSGSGKSTICDRLLADPRVVFSVSATTRAPRPGEVHGRLPLRLPEASAAAARGRVHRARRGLRQHVRHPARADGARHRRRARCTSSRSTSRAPCSSRPSTSPASTYSSPPPTSRCCASA